MRMIFERHSFLTMLKLTLIVSVLVHVNCFFVDSFYPKSDVKTSDYEIVYLPLMLPFHEGTSENDEVSEAQLSFTAFGRSIDLDLKINNKLVSPNFKTYVQDVESKLLPGSTKNCHYLHRNNNFVAAVSMCQQGFVQGFLFMDNSTLEIHPLASHSLNIQQPVEFADDEKIPHVIKKATIPPSVNLNEIPILSKFIEVEAANHRPVDAFTAEIALFFDAEAYRIFAPYFNYDEDKLRDMLLAYMNGIQALYHHPSLETNLELVLVRLDIMKRQPEAMPHYDGERSKLLNSFCDYQRSLNPTSDDNEDHWDMALYVSGLDFFAYENGRKSGVTMGLATVGGVCLPQYACVIGEFGTTNMFGKPYPSAGFTSVYIMAHEIGHNLGMHHDSVSNSCPKEGYIMSPSRGVSGETQWSSCSAGVMKKLHRFKCLYDSAKFPSPALDHSHFLDIPGQVFTAKKQCEILLRDRDAVMSPNQQLSKICHSLECKTPHRSGFYFAGPALEGTECGEKKCCFGGECVSKVFPTPVPSAPGGWGPWNPETCNSGCLKKAKGFQIQRRRCNNPSPVNTDRGCEGSSYRVALCKDDKICKEDAKKSAVEFATEKCKKFAKLLPELDPEGGGLQSPHEEGRIWMACSIFCRRKDTSIYYTPRVELNDLGVSPYFPDGTWCHTDKAGENYYCLQHHCLPEFSKSPKKPKNMFRSFEDIPIPQNAYPNDDGVALGLLKYLSISPEGKPLQTFLKPGQAKLPKEEDWETRDYVELPSEKFNEITKETMENASFDFME